MAQKRNASVQRWNSYTKAKQDEIMAEAGEVLPIWGGDEAGGVSQALSIDTHLTAGGNLPISMSQH